MVSFGQSNPIDTLFSINNIPYSSQEFLEIYQESSHTKQKQLSPTEALDLYILFQLKVQDAKQHRMDTLPIVKHDIEIGKEIAFNAFLYPSTISEEKIREAFERLQYFIRARQILVKTNKHANTEDTLVAYHEAQKIYKDLLKGKSFDKIARKQSDDPLVKEKHGELGYFTAFDMDYKFESASYALQVGEYSRPFRTQFGYHIIQILEKTPNPGKIKLQHILLSYQSNKEQKEAKEKIDSLYTLLINGADFSQLANKYSTYKHSAQNKEILPWIGLFETHPKIEQVAFKMTKIGEISKPIQTNLAYHILQLTAKKDYSSIDSCREEIEEMIANDSRSKQSPEELIAQIKKDYQFTENRALLSNFYSILDYAYADLLEPLFSLGGKDYSQEEFADYLSLQASKDIYENFIEYINRTYDKFTNNSILAFYKKQLLANNKELASLIQNYENRVLVFAITKQKVLIPATNNSEGLLEFYQSQKEKFKPDVSFESIKEELTAEYKAYLNDTWENELRTNNRIEISQSTVNKIAQ